MSMAATFEATPVWLKRAFVALMACSFLLASMPARATESDEGPLALTPVPLIHEGQEGDWFPGKQSEKMLLRLEHIGELEALVDKYEELQKANERTIKLALDAQKAAEDVAQAQKQRGDEFKALSEKQAKELASVWRQPWPWLLIGAGTTMLLLVLVGSTNASVMVVK